MPTVHPGQLDPATGHRPPRPGSLLNPAAGCRILTPITITPAEAQAGGAVNINNSTRSASRISIHDYSVITPEDTRFSVSGRVTKTFGANAQAYLRQLLSK